MPYLRRCTSGYPATRLGPTAHATNIEDMPQQDQDCCYNEAVVPLLEILNSLVPPPRWMQAGLGPFQPPGHEEQYATGKLRLWNTGIVFSCFQGM